MSGTGLVTPQRYWHMTDEQKKPIQDQIKRAGLNENDVLYVDGEWLAVAHLRDGKKHAAVEFGAFTCDIKDNRADSHVCSYLVFAP